VPHPTLIDVGVEKVVLVTLRAGRLASVLGREADTSKDVSPVVDSLKVIRVHTAPIPAQVVQHQAVRDRAAVDFVANPMGDR